MEQAPNSPRVGMKLSKTQSQLENGEFSLLVNGNIESPNGDMLVVTNEQSNLLCSRFKPGFKVIGLLPINTQNRTVFFLVNPETNESEIGYINNVLYEDVSDEEINCNECKNPLKEEELNTLIELCTYTTIVNADCLGFNINYPISSTYEIGIDVDTTLPDATNTTIFFTDFLNKRRYLNINNYPRQVIGYGDCNVPLYNDELDCDAIKVVPEYQSPCIEYIDAPIGGSNKAGVYQIAVAYANVEKLPLTDYSAISNPISLSSKKRTITVNTDYNTEKAIKFTINNVDTSFQYMNVVVLKTINSLTEAFLVATLPILSDSITYTYTGDNYQNEPRVTLDELLQKRAIYEHAKGVTIANKHLFWWNLKDQRQINLQPVISNIPIKWQTVEAMEGFYGNPLSADYVGYEGDEVYPIGIEFKKTNGYTTPTFLFVGRDKDYYLSQGINVEEVITGDNVISSETCIAELTNQRWQVYNTAISNGISECYSNPTGTQTVVIPNTLTCYSETFSVPSGTTDYSVQPCVTPSGNCSDPEADDYSCCDLVLVTPSGVVDLPIFECTDLTLESPPCDEKYPDWSTTYTPTNTSCVNADQYLMQVGNSCYLETYVCGTGDEQAVVSTMPYFIFKCGVSELGSDCDNAPSSRNSAWFQFQAISKEHLVRINTNLGNTTVKIFEGDCSVINSAIASGTPENAYVVNLDSDNNPSCKTGSGTVCLTLNNLEEGATYFVCLSTDYTCSDTNNIYGNICITAPQPESRYSYEQEALYRWRCLYNGEPTVIEVPIDPTCFTSPYKYGDFAYWQSTAKYPENKDVWGDLCGQYIRHFKFPDSTISHIHNNYTNSATPVGTNNRIYPKGIKIDINDIKEALNTAVSLGLISEQEKREITSYSIKRGNRRANRSVLAKGLLYDVWKTPVLDGQGNLVDSGNQKQYYPNYPYNDLQDDNFLLQEYEGEPIKHPYFTQNNKNNRYTFHSPNTSFNKPELGTELKLETVEWGKVTGKTSEVEKHAQYVLLKNKAYNVAKSLAALQINNEASSQAFGAGDSFGVLGTSGGAIINYIIYYAIGLATGFATNYTRYSADWLDIIKGLSTPINPALYLTSTGFYSSYTPVDNLNTIPKRRNLTNYRYLNSGNYNFLDNGESILFNNYERESSVFLSISKPGVSAFLAPDSASLGAIPSDNSRQKNCKITGSLPESTATSYYASIKDYKPDQYGTIDQIEWLDTGYCGSIDWDNPQDNSCDTIFGGDVYINRFALKRKMPFFLQDAVGLAEDSPIMYKNLSNVGFPRFFFNTLQDQSSLDKFSLPFLAPPNNNLDNYCTGDTLPFYYNGKIYLYNYGIPYFLCESDYNVDLRHGENDGDYKDFYPHVGDVVQWTQQYKNPISFDNTYYYNIDYSKQNRENFYYSLKNSYKNSQSYINSLYPNRAIYSGQGGNKWRQYLAADFYDFPVDDGQLIGLNAINQQQIVARQENSTKVFNAFITMESSLATIAISVGEMFQQKPREYFKTDLGFGGSSNTAFTTTPFGSFWVDAKNPSVLQLQGDSLKDITRDSKTNNKIQWFVENLPFNISKDFPTVDIDNNYKHFGLAMTFDNKYDRVFITKKDYKLKKEFKNQVEYTNFNFIYQGNVIEPTNSLYFEDKSWTVAYSPLLQEWMSFYSFTPNYYLQTEQYFASGLNYSNNTAELGFWNHLQTNKSFQSFYGTSYPFILEYSISSQLQSKILNNVSINSEFRRYQADLNYFVKDTATYDHAEIYNINQSTGRLHLIPKIKNNAYQSTQYPKMVGSETEILIENIEHNWRFSQGLLDISLQNGNPLYIYKGKPYKELNSSAISYQPKYLKNYLRNDWFAIRLENNNPLYRIEHKFTIQSQSNSNT